MRKIILVIFVLVAVIAAYFVFVWVKGGNKPDNNTANWGTYTSQEMGFQIEYPKEWRYEDCLTGGFGIVGFGQSDEKLLICNSDAPPLSYVNVAVVGLASDFDSLVKNLMEGLKNTKREDVLVAGQNAVKITGETPGTDGPGLPKGIKETNILLTHDNKIYLLMHFNLKNKDYLDTFYKMIGSFHFLSGSPAVSQN